jgi:hypothetical protein
MNSKFKELTESLEPKFQELINMAPARYGSLPKNLPKRAIYLFSQNGEHLYVGRTNNLRARLRGHCSPTAKHFSATFAFRIARQNSGRTKATYTSKGSRADLCNDEIFAPMFKDAKVKVANMDLRYVEEIDPVKQTLLEVYIATVLNTPYNDFENH